MHCCIAAARKPKLRPERGTQDLGVEPSRHIPQRDAVFITFFVHLCCSVLQCVAAMNGWVVSMTLGVQQCRGVILFGIACESDSTRQVESKTQSGGVVPCTSPRVVQVGMLIITCSSSHAHHHMLIITCEPQAPASCRQLLAAGSSVCVPMVACRRGM